MDTHNPHSVDPHPARAGAGSLPSTRETTVDTGLALARPIAIDRVWQEAARQIQRVLPYEALAMAVTDEDSGELRAVFQTGFTLDGPATIDQLRPRWDDVVARGTTRLDATPEGPELTVPIPGQEGPPIGAISVRYDRSEEDPPSPDAAEHALAPVAAQVAVAVERARAAHRLESSRAAESAARTAAAIGNELRQPLFAISSAAQLLRFQVREDPVVERNIGRILHEIERLNGLAAELLEYGAPHTLHLALIDPDTVWDEVLAGNRNLLEKRALALHRSRPTHPTKLRADSPQLAQAFLTTLRAIAEPAPPTTELTLRSRNLAGTAWRCTLSAPGITIPPDALPRIFEPFASVSPGGSGIGLALAQRIAHEHEGSITATSAADRGISITITLPIHR